MFKLKLKDSRTGETAEIEPIFNRAVIMQSYDYTLHGYDPINFPEDEYRRSIAAYAYRELSIEENVKARSTTWYPENAGAIKKKLGLFWPSLVAIKNKLLGSSTSKNQ